jgi:competence protein ComEC
VWSILANLLAEPIVAPATIIGLTAVLLAVPVPALAHALALVASIFTSITCWVASQASRLPLQLIQWPSGPIGQLAILVAILAALALVYRRRLGFARAALLLALALPVLVGLRHTAVSAHWPARDWVLANCDVGQGDGLVIRSQGQVMVIDVGRDPAPIAGCLQQLDVGEVAVLELTHFDLDHVGGVAGVLNGHKVEQAILTSFSDSRPGADATRRAVEAKGISVTLAGIGVSGQLGEVSWRVISPTLGASEAEDANDGSIGMLLEAPGFCLVTLADIGQPGQDRLLASRDSWFDPDCRNKPIVLKVGHHGSANQSAAFTQWLHPQIALISVGLANRYGHPTPSCLEMLASVGAQIWRTDRQGALALSTSADGLTMTVAGRG